MQMPNGSLLPVTSTTTATPVVENCGSTNQHWARMGNFSAAGITRLESVRAVARPCPKHRRITSASYTTRSIGAKAAMLEVHPMESPGWTQCMRDCHTSRERTWKAEAGTKQTNGIACQERQEKK